MNQALGNVGTDGHLHRAGRGEPVDQLQSLRELVADMDAARSTCS